MIDLIDKKILYYLEKDSRMPISKLSKLVSASRELVTYRISKLEEKNIIKSYIARINQSVFCNSGANFAIKLSNIDKKRHDEILSYLKSHGNINWFSELCGTYDLSISFLYRDSQELAKIISDITLFFGSNLISHSLCVYVSEYKFDRKGILELKEKNSINQRIETNFKELNKDKLDEKDITILKELAKNSKIKNIELANKIKMGEDIVRIRIKKLEKLNIIVGYTIVINPYALNLEGYSLYLQIEDMTENMQKKIKNYIYSNPNIYFCSRVAGKFNLIIGLYSKNRNHFKENLSDIRNFFGKSLKDYEFQLLMEEHKEIFIPDNLFD